MNTRLRTFGVCVGLFVSAFLSGPSGAAPPSINQFTSNNIKTMSLTSEITQDNQAELKKIQGDIALAYRLHRGSMQYMQPGKIRIEATIPHVASGYYIINGNRKCTVGPLYHRVQDITGAPGKKQTLLDFGFVPPELLDDYNATFLRKDGADYVFQISPKNGDTTKDIIWVDPKTHITVKRENYDRHGKILKWFLYKNPVKLSVGIYVPTVVELYNPENKLAGVTAYQSVHVNSPIDPSVFNF
jgi:outer membrane lipoprotein-sorting protein